MEIKISPYVKEAVRVRRHWVKSGLHFRHPYMNECTALQRGNPLGVYTDGLMHYAETNCHADAEWTLTANDKWLGDYCWSHLNTEIAGLTKRERSRR